MATQNRHQKLYLNSGSGYSNKKKNNGSGRGSFGLPNGAARVGRKKESVSNSERDYNSVILSRVSQMTRLTDKNYQSKIENYKKMYEDEQKNHKQYTDTMKSHIDAFQNQYKVLNDRHLKSQNDNKTLREYIKKSEVDVRRLKGECTKLRQYKDVYEYNLK